MHPFMAPPVLATVDDRGAQVGVWALGSAPCAVHLRESVLGQFFGRGAIAGEKKGEAVCVRPRLAKEVLERGRNPGRSGVRLVLRSVAGKSALVAGCLCPHAVIDTRPGGEVPLRAKAAPR